MRIKVYFTDKQVSDSGSFSPSASKPQKVVDDWLKSGFPIDIVSPGPMDKRDFYLAHDTEYVNDVLRCKEPNGFGTISESVAASLPYTTGSMYAAAKHAYKYREKPTKYAPVAVSPTSGFHHACYAHGGGFCTFNGLVVTAQKLKFETKCERVGILDLDNHYGNGTDQIIGRLKLDYIEHFSGGASYHSEKQAETFLKMLPTIMHEKFKGCDVLLYQAGADPHINDPLGGWLTTEQMAERDRIVFEMALEMGIPVAWNLAGGYQVEKDGSIPKVLEIHNNTMRVCLEVYGSKKEKGAA